MAEVVSPAVARRRVRLALREAREAANLTQQQVADEMEWSLSKVIRIENGDVTIAPNDLRPLLSFLRVKDKNVISALLVDARIARTRQRQAWYQKPQFRDVLSDGHRRLIEYETEAAAIRYFSIYFIPGPLQLPAYLDALLRLWGDEIPASTRQILIEARQHRREALLSRGAAVDLFVLLDESVLMRPIGGPEVFAEQLRDLHQLAQDGVIKLRMLPFTLNAPVTNSATYDLLSLDQSDGGMLLYLDHEVTDEVVEAKAITQRHRDRYDRVWVEALDETDTMDFVLKRISDLEGIPSDRQREHR